MLYVRAVLRDLNANLRRQAIRLGRPEAALVALISIVLIGLAISALVAAAGDLLAYVAAAVLVLVGVEGLALAVTKLSTPSSSRVPFHGVPDDFEPRTPQEAAFLPIVLSRTEGLDVWPRLTADGAPWLLLSVDLPLDGGGIAAVPRLDFIGDSIAGAYSPAHLNWDSELTAAEAGIDVRGLAGIERTGPPEELAAAAVDWFATRRKRWREESQLPGRTPSRPE